jgi:hypothetical protein
MRLLPAWGTGYTHKLEMLHSVGYNQHQKTQVKSINVLRIAAIMGLLCKGTPFEVNI